MGWWCDGLQARDVGRASAAVRGGAVTIVETLEGLAESIQAGIEDRRRRIERIQAELVAEQERQSADEVRAAETYTALNLLRRTGLKAWRDEVTGFVNVSIDP